MIKLTEREHDVMNLIIKGKSNKEISKILVITSHTVKAHIDSIYRKMNVHNRVQAAMIYVQYFSNFIREESFNFK